LKQLPQNTVDYVWLAIDCYLRGNKCCEFVGNNLNNGNKIIKQPIPKSELKKIAQEGFGDLIKAAVDIEKGIVAIGGELHMDELELLVEKEKSDHRNVWGINLYPGKEGDEFMEI